MATRPIVKIYESTDILRRKAEPVAAVSRRMRDLMSDMVDTVRQAEGVGLAAPQIGHSIQIIVVEVPQDMDDPDGPKRLWTLANPRILWSSAELEEGREACLSIPDLFGDVERHLALRVEALDRFGKRLLLELQGFEARVFQHEIDHLNGILFYDRISDPQKLYHLEEDDDGNWVQVPVAMAGDEAG